MSPAANPVRFASFEINSSSGELRRHGVRLKVGEQPFRLLWTLVQHAGQVVGREELRQQLWPADTFVDFEHSVNAAVKRLREVLDDSADSPRYIETIPRHGYRFIYPVEGIEASSREPPVTASPPPGTESIGLLSVGARHFHTRAAVYMAIGCVLFVLGYATNNWLVSSHSSNQASVEFDILPPPGQSFATEALSRSVVISPDGSRIVFRASGPDGARLYAREMNSIAATVIPGTRGAFNPFFSPDSQWLGFSAGGEIKTVALSGGQPVTVCRAPGNIGGTWNWDGNIYFADSDPAVSSGVFRVPARGGSPQVVIDPRAVKSKDLNRFWPEMGVNSKTLLLTAWEAWPTDNSENARIVAIRTDTGAERVLLEGARDAHFIAPGYLVFVREGKLFAVAYDPDRLQIKGTPVIVLENLLDIQKGGFGFYDISNSGTLTYLSGGVLRPENNLVWKDRAGKTVPLGLKPDVFQSPRISPNGQELAVTVRSPDAEIWVYDLKRQTLRRMTSSAGEDEIPVWSPDGQRIAYASNGRKQAFWLPRDGSTPEHLLMTAEQHVHLTSWSPDGKRIAFEQATPEDRWEIWMLPLDPSQKPYPYLQTAFNERTPAFSPDGQWLAYASDESGQFQVYVQRVQGPAEKIVISKEGGTEPVWSRNGRELYFLSSDKLLGVTVAFKPRLTASKPHELFTFQPGATSSGPNYDVTANAEKFVVIERGKPAEPSRMHVVLNWASEVRRQMAAQQR